MRGHSVIYIPKRRSLFTIVNCGLLYNSYAAGDSRKILSSDSWFIPNYTDLNYSVANSLFYVLGGSTAITGKLKETGIISWNTPNTGATNELGFNAKGSGRRISTGFEQLKTSLSIHSSFISGDNRQYVIALHNSSTSINNTGGWGNRSNGLSLRPFRMATTPELSLPDGIVSSVYTGNDGKVYRCCKIGNKIWLADNLNETKFRNGSWIHGFDGGTYTPISNTAWAALTTDGCCAYADNLANV